MGTVINVPGHGGPREAIIKSDASGNFVGLAVDGQPYLPLRAPESSPLPLLQRAWESMPFISRSRLISAGQMPGVPKLMNYSDAVVPDGTNETSLTNAIAAAVVKASGGQPGIVLLKNNIVMAANVTVSSAVVIVSDNGSSISGAGSIILSSNSELRGIDIAVPVTFTTAAPTSNTRIFGCKFTYIGQQIYDAGVSTSAPHAYLKILWNEFVGAAGVYGVYFTNLLRAKIQFNWYHATIGQGRGIFGLGLSQSLVRHNHIDGAIVGIGVLFDRSIARISNGTIVSQNLVENISEEGISVDAYGNIGTKMSCVDRLVVSSTSGTPSSSPSIICTRTTPNETTGISAGVSVVVLTGSAAGLALKTNYITASGVGAVRLQFVNNTITSSQLTALVGQTVSVQYVNQGWSIEENYLRNCFSPILSWGMLCNSQITRNIIDAPSGVESIKSCSLGGLNPSTAIMAPNGCFSASSGVSMTSNRIINNKAGAKITYSGTSYGLETDTTPHISPLPAICGDNSESVVVESWKSATGAWLSSSATSVLSAAGVTNPDVDVFRSTIDLDNSADETWLSGKTQGVALLSGTGAVVTFNIPHGLGVAPSNIWWGAMSSDAKGDAFTTSDATNIILTYAVAPPAGTNNVVLSWSASA